MNNSRNKNSFATTMSDEIRKQLLATQTECTVIWSTQTGEGVGATMSYLWAKNKFWLTTQQSSPRINAIKRNPSVSVVVSGAGTNLGKSRGISIRGKASLHQPTDDVGDWFFTAYTKHLLPESVIGAEQLEKSLRQPQQIIIEITPEKWICYDGQHIMNSFANMK